jgi:6-pyruvoyltetrahydropterin/6-carboxytetrahydropterin synthase
MYELKIEDSFAAAHKLRCYQGPCEELHGHNWKIEVVVRADRLDELGLVIDFKDLKAAAQEVLGSLDHRYLNDLPAFAETNPSSENIARHIFQQIASRIHREGLWVEKVTAWESEKACASYIRDRVDGS